MKKFMVLGIVFGVLLSSFSFALGLKENEKFFYNPTPVATEVDEVSESENIGKIFAEGSVNAEKTLLNGFLGLFGFGGSEYTGMGKALIYIKSIINLLLGLVSFIALVMIIYSFYLMFFSENTQGMERVKKNLKGVAIALVILGLSRIIISFIFNFYQENLLAS